MAAAMRGAGDYEPLNIGACIARWDEWLASDLNSAGRPNETEVDRWVRELMEAA